MQITVKLLAALRRYRPDVPRGQALSLDVLAGTTVHEVVQQLGIPDNVPLVAMVNSGVCRLDHVLVEGDKLALFPPVAGG
ncbi:MAG: MoaD/ThiS family protein [Anaerolineales bacterium]|nr:MAG: MoaD/ThiS family protein [Anaerolineales bacterium]